MMKIKTLTKDQKRKLKKELLASEEGLIYRKANRLYIICIVGITYALFVTAYDIYNQTGLINYILDGLLFVFSGIFALKVTNIKRQELYKYYVSKQKEKPEEKKPRKNTRSKKK